MVVNVSILAHQSRVLSRQSQPLEPKCPRLSFYRINDMKVPQIR